MGLFGRSDKEQNDLEARYEQEMKEAEKQYDKAIANYSGPGEPHAANFYRDQAYVARDLLNETRNERR